jgi:hypothetical protein
VDVIAGGTSCTVAMRSRSPESGGSQTSRACWAEGAASSASYTSYLR